MIFTNPLAPQHIRRENTARKKKKKGKKEDLVFHLAAASLAQRSHRDQGNNKICIHAATLAAQVLVRCMSVCM